MSKAREGNREKGDGARGAEHHDPPEVIRELLDSAMTGDRERLDELLRQRPHLRDEFEGLYEANPKVQMALRKHPEYFGPEYEEIRNELSELIAEKTADDERRIGELTALTRNWSRPEVVQFYLAFAGSIVSIIASEIGLDMKAHEIRAHADYLCSLDMVARLRKSANEGPHVRDVLIEVLAERWKMPDLVRRLSREKLEELLIENRVLRQHLAVWEDKLAEVA